MSTIVETIQAIIRHELRALRVAEIGCVEAVTAAGCDVRLKDGDLLLRALPAAGRVLPNIGDVVLVTFEGGDLQRGVIVGQLYGDAEPPIALSADESGLVLRVGQGMQLTMLSDGSVAIETAGDLILRAAGALRLESDTVTVNGNILLNEGDGDAR